MSKAIGALGRMFGRAGGLSAAEARAAAAALRAEGAAARAASATTRAATRAEAQTVNNSIKAWRPTATTTRAAAKAEHATLKSSVAPVKGWGQGVGDAFAGAGKGAGKFFKGVGKGAGQAAKYGAMPAVGAYVVYDRYNYLKHLFDGWHLPDHIELDMPEVNVTNPFHVPTPEIAKGLERLTGVSHGTAEALADASKNVVTITGIAAGVYVTYKLYRVVRS